MRSVALALGTVLLLASAPCPAQETNSELGEMPHVFITILQGKLKPEVQKLTPNDAVGWLNYTDKIARVSFDKEVAKRMVCKKEGSFKLNGDRLESSNIQAQQFATLCVLSKGEYTYKVDLFSGAGGGAGNVPTTREGKLVIE
jgi:hypothetical protein